jgi:hypothetical protein
MNLDVPVGEFLISAVDSQEARLSVRLVSDYHPDSTPQAYLVVFEDPEAPHTAAAFLERCLREQTAVYLIEKANAVEFETEGGEYCEVKHGGASLQTDTFNASELSVILKRVYGWYISSESALRAANDKIDQASRLLVESSRRIEIKAASHTPNSTAATLYSQQADFVRRVLSMLKANADRRQQ